VVGLLLGFTFAMSLSRYDSRLSMVVTEANDIRTTALRARALPEPHPGQVVGLLRQYIDARLDLYSPGVAPERVRRVEERSAELRQQLWQHAVATARLDPRSIPTGLFMQSLNNVIDDDARRAAGRRNRVPVPVLLLLLLVSLLAVALSGYGSGVTEHRRPWLALVMSVLIALVILTIVGMDRPKAGAISVSQQAMVDLRNHMRAGFP
jgi:hypothetical protein